MATFTIILAKTYFKQKINDNNPSVDYDTYLTNALTPAISSFKGSKLGVGKSNYLFYINTPADIDIISDEAESTTSHAFYYDNSLATIQKGDIIILADSRRLVISSSDSTTEGEGKIVVDGAYSGADTTFQLSSMEAMSSLFAWLVVYYFTYTAYDLILSEIIAESKSFGEGAIISPQNEIERYRKQILQNIENERATINTLTPVAPNFYSSIPIRM